MDRVPPPGLKLMAGQTLEQKVAALEQRLATLENLLQLSSDGSLTVEATKISLHAMSVEVKAATSLVLRSGGTADMKAGSTMKLESAAAAMMKTGGGLDINASGTASVKAPVLILNGGTKPLARRGDMITPTGPPGSTSTIAEGSSTILG